MKVGAILPQTEMDLDAGALRAWAQAVEQLGYHHIVMYDHVLGVDVAMHPGWRGPYDVTSTFRDVFVTLGYLAACTTLELATGVLVLPQRQAAVVAKQAADVAALSAGGLRLGVGAGWNAVEMESLGADFSNRGRRIDEQISVMRRLWAEPSVRYDGSFHRLDGVGVAPRPSVRIPVWIGAVAPAALRRVGRLADGWFAPPVPPERCTGLRAVIDAAAIEAGRDPSDVATEGRISASAASLDRIAETAAGWRQGGATHVSVATLNDGIRGVDAHIERLGVVAAVLGLDPTSRRGYEVS